MKSRRWLIWFAAPAAVAGGVVALAWLGEARLNRQNREVAEWVLRVGGEGDMDKRVRGNVGMMVPLSRWHPKLPRGVLRIRDINLEGKPVSDSDLRRLKGLYQLQTLNLARTKVTDAGLTHLAGLNNVLSPWDSLKSFRPVRYCSSLQSLDLRGTRVTDAGLGHLTGLPSLSWLYLGDCPVSGGGLAHLRGSPNLSTLDLGNTPVTDAGLSQLPGLFPHLHDLYLRDAPVGDDGLASLGGLRELHTLDLARTKVSDAGLPSLQALASKPSLCRLDLSQTGITDAGLPHLSRLTQLSELHLDGTKVTAAGIRELERALPACRGLHSQLDRRAAEWALRRGATVAVVSELRGREKTTKTVEDLPAGWISIRGLTFAGTPLRDADLSRLQGLPDLERLDLQRTQVTDAGLPYLKDMEKLRTLLLQATRVTDADFTYPFPGMKEGVRGCVMGDVEALRFVALGQARAGDPRSAQTFEQALQAACALQDSALKAYHLRAVAVAQAMAGDRTAATATLRQATLAADGIADTATKANVRATIAAAEQTYLRKAGPGQQTAASGSPPPHFRGAGDPRMGGRADQIPAGEVHGPALVVENSSAQPLQSVPVSLPLASLPGRVRPVGEKGQALPAQVDALPQGAEVALVVPHVPAGGTAVIRLQPGTVPHSRREAGRDRGFSLAGALRIEHNAGSPDLLSRVKLGGRVLGRLSLLQRQTLLPGSKDHWLPPRRIALTARYDGPVRTVCLLTAEGSGSRSGEGAFRATVRLDHYPAEEWLSTRLVDLANTGKAPWRCEIFLWLPYSVVAGYDADHQETNTPGMSLWHDRATDISYGGLAVSPETTISFWRDGPQRRQQHPDICAHLRRTLAPGQRLETGFGMAEVRIFGTRGSRNRPADSPARAKALVRVRFVPASRAPGAARTTPLIAFQRRGKVYTQRVSGGKFHLATPAQRSAWRAAVHTVLDPVSPDGEFRIVKREGRANWGRDPFYVVRQADGQAVNMDLGAHDSMDGNIVFFDGWLPDSRRFATWSQGMGPMRSTLQRKVLAIPPAGTIEYNGWTGPGSRTSIVLKPLFRWRADLPLCAVEGSFIGEETAEGRKWENSPPIPFLAVTSPVDVGTFRLAAAQPVVLTLAGKPFRGLSLVAPAFFEDDPVARRPSVEFSADGWWALLHRRTVAGKGTQVGYIVSLRTGVVRKLQGTQATFLTGR